MSRYSSILCLLALLWPFSVVATTITIAGYYDELPVAYDPATGTVSGYFNQATGAGNFTCIFYFSGTLQGNKAHIISYSPEYPEEKIEGDLTFSTSPKPSIAIALKDEHGGCWNVAHFADPKPAEFTMDAAHPTWASINVVKSKKAHFYSAPDKASKRSSYLVKGDAVAIIDKQGDWYHVEYQGSERVSGYFKKSDLYALPLK